ncbi:TadG family pilus assembly protein [Cupriavidus basilensis]|uniref:TadG family pilus assembly protein n=1 Tax=Cupriavidus basilensis TaxID=68895 RepID=UPI00284D04EF|nr:TadG family pilus assembly protein [Cupriavidus basilensis]MDR3382455.1 TadG family pilus assembly protein [Cupriavidus basilensis]
MIRCRSHLVAGRRRGQRGAIGVLGALLLATVAIGSLVSIDVGHVFYRQRQLQKIADMAALAGAQQLKQAAAAATVSANVLSATQSAGAQNDYAGTATANCSAAGSSDADGMRVCLGVWDPAYSTGSDTARHFNAGYDTTKLSANAVQVVVTQTVPILFVIPGSASRQLRAEAIANASPPVASFSLGSGLLDFNSGNSLLSGLLGTSVRFSAADWQGLLNANVTLDQLRLKLGAGTIDDLLKTSLSIQQFYALVLGAAGKDALLSTALGSPPTQLGLSGVKANVGVGQLLNLGVLAPAASSAADVALNVASLLTLGAQVANGTAAVTLPLSLTVPGIAGVSTQLYVVQPPVMAVGPARQLSGPPATWQTTAHTAQVGLRLDVQVNTSLDTNQGGGITGLLLSIINGIKGVVNGIVNVQLNVPLYVEVAAATASLQSIQCAAAKADCRATLGVTTGLVTACLANPTGTGCANSATLADVALLGLLGTPVRVTVQATASPRSVPVNSSTVTLAPGDTKRVGTQQVLGGVIQQVVAGIVPTATVTVLGIDLLKIPVDLTVLLQPLVTALNVDAVLNTLLGALGIQLGYADIWMQGIDCNNAELVF